MKELYTSTQLLFSAKYIVVLPKRLQQIKIIVTIYIGIADIIFIYLIDIFK